MKKIIFATSNEEKMKEIREIMSDTGLQIQSMKEAGISVDILENGATFEENALIKARTVAEVTGEITLADDSGLEVDFLDKAPGIYSARFLGETTDYHTKNNYIIRKLEGVSVAKRTARFVCAVACVWPDGKSETKRGTIEGYIGYEERGTNGFGYDPIFMVPEFNKSTAELSMSEKNAISHRGKALKMMKEELM